MRSLLCLVLVLLTGCGYLPLGGPATWPLRGTPDGSGATRRPVVVKVANDFAARPHSGLAAADVVLEIPVEGGITRLALVFHSMEPEDVGPVRSARSTDIDEASRLRAILVHVGASQAVAREVRDAASGGAFVQVDEFEHPDAFERIRERVAPYNAYTSGELVRDAAGDRGSERVSVPALAFGAAPTGGAPGEALEIPFGDPADVRYEYDSGLGAYHRYHGGDATMDDHEGVEVLPENVIVIFTDVTEISGTSDVAGAPSLEYRGTGSGEAIVMRDGMRWDVNWSRGGSDMWRFTDASGNEVRLKPGLTWIHILPTSVTVRT